MLLAEQVVIVCGIGPGLGASLALSCVGQGAHVVMVARSEAVMKRLEAQMMAGGNQVLAIKADATRPEDAGRVVEVTTERFGRIDGLINNAAVIPPLVSVDEVAPEVLSSTIDSNLYAAFHITQAVIPTMRAQGRGSIVMVGSAVVRHPKVGFGAYNVAKHAMLGLVRSLALELGPSGIRINTLAPGKIAGERLERFFEERARLLGISVEEMRDRYTANTALRRLPHPDEYADVAVFLLSDLSRSITGHLLDANGGEYFD